jgi:mRNA interferase MazF
MSPRPFWVATRFLIVCPITSRIRPFGTSVALPPGLAIAGEILTSHVRSIDTLAQRVSPAGGFVPPAVPADARGKLAALTASTDSKAL